MPNRSKRILTHVTIIVIAFVAGVCAGVILYPEILGGTPVAAETDEQHVDEEEVIVLSEPAIANLGLTLGRVTIDDYWKVQTLPGEVVEIPGESDLSVAAPVSGVVERVAIRTGESVASSDHLFDLRITDQAVTTAQSELLNVLSQLEVAQTEIDRLAPLTAEGTVSRKRKRELEYQVRTLGGQRQTKVQEILALGLPRQTLDQVLATKQLATWISIAVPIFTAPRSPRANELTKEVSISDGERDYSITSIHCHPGLAVQAGDALCDLSYHGKLYIRGQAFESDVASITRLSDSPWRITAEFGHQHHAQHQHTILRQGLRVTHVDNHVDPVTQTFSFFLPLTNDVVQDVKNDNRLYREWRFKPGQRVHLRLPIDKHAAKIKLPIDAVAVEGPNAVVFRKHVHLHSHAPGEPHDDHEEEDLELEPVQVHVLYRDDRFAVINPDGELKVGDEVAMNSAYKLQLALKMNAGGGGGHDHDH